MVLLESDGEKVEDGEVGDVGAKRKWDSAGSFEARTVD